MVEETKLEAIEEIINEIPIKKNDQLKRAKEMLENLDKLNSHTLRWLYQSCKDILDDRKIGEKEKLKKLFESGKTI